MDHGRHISVSLLVRRRLSAAAGALALLTLVGMVLLRPGGGEERPDIREAGAPSQFFDGRVTAIRDGPCPNTVAEEGIDCEIADVRLLAGPDRGQAVALDFPKDSSGPELERGDKIVLGYSPQAEEGFRYHFADRQRKPVLAWLAVIFALGVVALGRARGLTALAGLAASLVVLLGFAVPAIIDGRSPIWVAVVAASAISFLALYLAHGLGPMTTVALIGTLASLALTALLAVAFVELAEFSGLATEEATFLRAAAGRIDLNGLLLAGVVIGALGALDDMTVTQASAVWELRAANPEMSVRRLFTAGLRIGRDHVAATVNTLFLAYAGASMVLLVLFVLAEQSLGAVANSEVVAVEIVRTLVGSVGLVASVPFTTWVAAHVVSSGASPAPRRSR